jgi:hypothetical protein
MNAERQEKLAFLLRGRAIIKQMIENLNEAGQSAIAPNYYIWGSVPPKRRIDESGDPDPHMGYIIKITARGDEYDHGIFVDGLMHSVVPREQMDQARPATWREVQEAIDREKEAGIHPDFMPAHDG